MPEIFSRNCKLNLIEYGSSKQDLALFMGLKAKIFQIVNTVHRKKTSQIHSEIAIKKSMEPA